MNRLLILSSLLLIVATELPGQVGSSLRTETSPLDAYDVVWETPSADHQGSMPIGNGDLGANVWVDPEGVVSLLLSKTDAWSGNARLLKLGRVLIRFTPNPFTNGGPFQQRLHLRDGEIVIQAGRDPASLALALWIDAQHPVVHLEAESPTPMSMAVDLDLWRTQRRELTGNELNSAYGLQGAPFQVFVEPDSVVTNVPDAVVWYHRNQTSIWENNLRHQGLDGFLSQTPDPLLGHTFGGWLEGPGCVRRLPTRLESRHPGRRLALAIHPYAAQTESVADWLSQNRAQVDRQRGRDHEAAREEHRAWWRAFWNRSWIRARGTEDAEFVSRAYTLQRWITACAGRGKYPIKFNGSIFTVDGAGYDADYRAWGGPYWWQNTRLPYWPMLAAGDFDLMEPLFQMYQAMLPLATFRTKTWFGHDGAFIGETVYFWGMYNNNNYGWERPPDLPIGELTNPYIRREYTASLELLAMMLDYHAYTADAEFVRARLLPMADALLPFWEQHYRTNESGHLIMYPAQALETLQDAENPTPDVAGLHWVLGRLRSLPDDLAGPRRHDFWDRLAGRIPPLPLTQLGGETVIAGAAKVHGGRGNIENPELYAIFPFRIFGVGKPDLALARRTFEHRTVKGNRGWQQDDTQAAYLGLVDIAAECVADRARNKHPDSRFPAFWGPNFDWVPDQDHGGNLMMALQTMLLQAQGDTLRLLPAWPRDWDVDFKLHAPRQTVVEGRFKDGRIQELRVTPPSRRKDLVFEGMLP